MTKDTKEIAYWQDGTWCPKEDLYKFPLKTLETPSILALPTSYKSDRIEAIVQDIVVSYREVNNEHQ